MKIINGNCLQEIKNIVQAKAKFQKVMVVFDETITSIEIGKIYEAIKGFCVYNQVEINKLDEQELLNGYKLIIYCCSVQGYFKCGFNKEEFVNVFFTQDDCLLPYFLTQQCCLDKGNHYLIIQNKALDLQMLSSVWFNLFYNYFKGLINEGVKSYELTLQLEEITHHNLFESVLNLSEDFQFVDVEILKENNIDYSNLILIDIMLIDAFLLLIEAIKEENYMIVDVYKATNQEESEIDKFYKLFNNENFINLIILNYNCLHNFCLRTKQKILQLIGLFELDINIVDELINKIKIYAKKDNGLLSYLYLYDIFSV